MSTAQRIKKIKEKLIQYRKLLESDNFPVQRLILYGSYAKGNFKPYSDIDVCVVSRRLARNKDKNETYLWKKVLEIDPRIEPVGYAPEDFDPIDPLVYEIKKYGVEIK